MPIRPEPDRDQWGRYKLPTPTGPTKAFTRATTVAKALEDLNGVMKWEGRCIVAGLGSRPDLYDLAATADTDDKKALGRIAMDAKKAGGSESAANRGTAIHSAFENSILGLPVGDKHRKYVERINAALTNAGLTVEESLVERVVVNYETGTAGTFDNGLRDTAGNLYVGDLKTGSVDYPGSFAVQLAIYATCDALISEDYKSIENMPEFNQNRAVIIHCPVDAEDGGDPDKATGRADIYWLDIRRGAEALALAYKVREWRKEKELLLPVDATEPTPLPIETEPVHDTPTAARVPAEPHTETDTITTVAWLNARYDAYKAHSDYPGPAATRRLWPDDLPPPSKFADMTADQMAAADKALIVLEATLELPFPTPNPEADKPAPRHAPIVPRTEPKRLTRKDTRTVDYEAAKTLKNHFEDAPPEVQQTVHGWVKEGSEASTAWNLGNIDRGAVSRRRWSISRAALFLALWIHDDPPAEGALIWAELVLDDVTLEPGHDATTGGILGMLTTEQADLLADLAREGSRPSFTEALKSLTPTN